MRALYVNPMSYGANPGVDAIAHGLQHRLATAGVELRVVFADFARPDWLDVARGAIDGAVQTGFDAIVIYVLDPDEPAGAVARARAAGLRVVSFERPRFPVDGSADDLPTDARLAPVTTATGRVAAGIPGRVRCPGPSCPPRCRSRRSPACWRWSPRAA